MGKNPDLPFSPKLPEISSFTERIPQIIPEQLKLNLGVALQEERITTRQDQKVYLNLQARATQNNRKLKNSTSFLKAPTRKGFSILLVNPRRLLMLPISMVATWRRSVFEEIFLWIQLKCSI
ncbi:hypothetical protein RJ641_015167 [Dillenia turbinata]|uniref:Uncharacterized protein n=1 Tax=Dillenia turbinata TaxID=194707 RepID=A0AAN8Z3G0_9MAGN